ncbi:MAG TPA: arginine repressor [Actinomycetota bacterium]|nr:arginine repressor [Actinomycetota bacterium]
MRARRRRDLISILHEGHATSQQEIVAALQAAGHDVTQATVSRDLSEIGATKARVEGRLVYRLPDELPHGNGDLITRGLMRTLFDFATDIVTAGTLVVVHTAPGHASAVARAIDLAGLPEVVGTIAGDDTIFVATSNEGDATGIARNWNSQIEEVS